MDDMFDYGTDTDITNTIKSERVLLVDGSNILFKLSAMFEKDTSQQDDFLTKLERELLLQTDNEDEIFAQYMQDEKYRSYKRNMFKSFLTKINMHYKKLECTKVYLTFDIGKSWRVLYTKGEFEQMIPLTNRIYKGNRRKEMTTQQLLTYKMMKHVCGEILTFFEQHTNIKCFYKPILEADDIISHLPNLEPHNTFIIVSSDGDLAQLQRFPNVIIFDAYNNKIREKIDVEWFLFEKCIRGDKTDHVRSSYPRVQTTRLEKAFNDPFDYLNLMETEWTDENKKTIKVKDAFSENQLLMDLTMQPLSIKNCIKELYENITTSQPKQVNKFTLGVALSEMDLDHMKEELFANKYIWIFK